MIWYRFKRLIMSDSLPCLLNNRCRYGGQRGVDSEYSSDATSSIQRKTAGIISKYKYFVLLDFQNLF